MLNLIIVKIIFQTFKHVYSTSALTRFNLISLSNYCKHRTDTSQSKAIIRKKSPFPYCTFYNFFKDIQFGNDKLKHYILNLRRPEKISLTFRYLNALESYNTQWPWGTRVTHVLPNFAKHTVAHPLRDPPNPPHNINTQTPSFVAIAYHRVKFYFRILTRTTHLNRL